MRALNQTEMFNEMTAWNSSMACYSSLVVRRRLIYSIHPVSPSSYLDYVINALFKLSIRSHLLSFRFNSISLSRVFPIELNCYSMPNAAAWAFREHLIGAELVEVKYDSVIFHCSQRSIPSSLYFIWEQKNVLNKTGVKNLCCEMSSNGNKFIFSFRQISHNMMRFKL